MVFLLLLPITQVTFPIEKPSLRPFVRMRVQQQQSCFPTDRIPDWRENCRIAGMYVIYARKKERIDHSNTFIIIVQFNVIGNAM